MAIERSSQLVDNPWGWRPSPASWLDQLAARASRWNPSPICGGDRSQAGAAVQSAACRGDLWLLHPILSAITLDDGEASRTKRDFQLLVWLAAHDAIESRPVDVPEPMWTWAPGGSFLIEPGTHDLAELGAAVAASQAFGGVALDVWCHTLSMPARDTWAARSTLTDEEQQRLEREIVLFLRALAMLDQAIPGCSAWISAATSVVIPLCADDTGQFRSGSSPDLPGLVQLDLGDELQILEGLVHETAHRHLYLAETEAPLVDSSHHGAYHSPLRTEPRPLRGIFMAWHALAYIALLYRGLQQAGAASGPGFDDDLGRVRTLLDDAEETMTAARPALTPAGQAFFERTRDVARHARS